MGNKDKTQDENATTSSEESRDTALARTITQAVAEAFAKQKAKETKLITETFTRQMEKTQAQYEELLKASRAQNFPSTLKITSSSQGFRVMDPFDWTHHKNIYQRWQLWSMKARLALDAMEGDNEKTKISYLHHWLCHDLKEDLMGTKFFVIFVKYVVYDWGLGAQVLHMTDSKLHLF